ncbi:MAG TPA: rhodanese-like domain-containing protein [Rhodocyclaceae bacterium]|nr:rhodanese-like domain-containing protein [Rhodocyclaceae bacterium]
MKQRMFRKALVLAVAAVFPFAGAMMSVPLLDGVGVAQAAEQSKEGWYKNIVGTDFVKECVQTPPRNDVMIIDARPVRQFEQGHLPGVVNIPDSRFDQMTSLLPDDKGRLIVVYCGGLQCMLSHNVAFKLEKLGYTNVQVYAEGMPAWSHAFPNTVVTAAGGMAAMPAAMAAAASQMMKKAVEILPGKDKGTISAPSFDQIFRESPEAVMFVDVRDVKEFATATIKGAVNIPINQLEKKVESLPADKPVIFFCGTGGRAGEAYDTVKLIRPEVKAYFLDAEMEFNPDGSYKITKAK